MSGRTDLSGTITIPHTSLHYYTQRPVLRPSFPELFILIYYNYMVSHRMYIIQRLFCLLIFLMDDDGSDEYQPIVLSPSFLSPPPMSGSGRR